MSTLGRPTEYNEEILNKAKEYLESCTDTDKGVKLPSIEGLARYLQIARSTLYLWEKEHQDFSDILEDIKTEQAERLINNGLSGNYNSTITKLILTKHGYSDKTESDVTSGGKPIPILGNFNALPTDDSDTENSSP